MRFGEKLYTRTEDMDTYDRFGRELYGRIEDTDIYDPVNCIYAFLYNEAGSIAYYYLNNDEILELAKEAIEIGETYIGALLGPGGYVIDPVGEHKPWEWEFYEGEAHSYEDIYEFLDENFTENTIDAMPEDIIKYFEGRR